MLPAVDGEGKRGRSHNRPKSPAALVMLHGAGNSTRIFLCHSWQHGNDLASYTL